LRIIIVARKGGCVLVRFLFMVYPSSNGGEQWGVGWLALGLVLIVGMASAASPEANFSAYAKATKYVNVPFTDTSVNATGWYWTFGDGGSSVVQNATHMYTSAGEFTVTLNVTNGELYNETSQNITIVEENANIIDENFASSARWTTTEGSPTYTSNEVQLVNNYGEYDTVESKFTYNEDEYVKIQFQGAEYNTTFVGNEYNSYQFYIDGIQVSSPNIPYDAGFQTVTYEYDGDGHYRLNGGSWNNIAVSGEWTFKMRGGSGGSGSNNYGIRIKNLYIQKLHMIKANVTSGTVPLTVSFADDSYSTTDWNWSFGDGNWSFDATPTHTYADAGSYTVTLTAESEGYLGDIVANTTSIQVDAPLLYADFTANTTSGYLSVTAQFNSTSGNATSFNWSFGDGTYSELENPVHTYSTVGSYDVKLYVENEYGGDWKNESAYITVLPPILEAAFFADVTSGYIPLTVQFTSTS